MYCDFLSFCVAPGEVSRTGAGEETKGLIDPYLRSLCAEIQTFGTEGDDSPQRGKTGEYVVDTIFIGGGTPSLLTPEQIGEILGAVSARFPIAKNAEISMESNPGSFYTEGRTKEESGHMQMTARLKAYRETGVNRLSIGAQSLHEDTLRFLGRLHTKEQFLDCYRLARQAGFDNINVDMMFGIPGTGFGSWQEDIRQITNLQPEHISFYSLKIEEGTPMWRRYQLGDFEEIDPALDRRMYGAALDILAAAGYEHYEISNAAKPGRACRHNLKYWSMDEYLGFGLGASAYLRFGEADTGSRRVNTDVMDEYLKAVQTEWQQNTKQDEISEYIFTGLRKIRGIRTDDFENRFGKSIYVLYEKQIQKLCGQGLLENDGRFLRLTRQGINISNRVFVEFV